MPAVWREQIARELHELERQFLLRHLPEPRLLESTPDFHSNDYLGLSRHPAVIEAAIGYISKNGFGSGGSRLISGNRRIHQQLEECIAAYKCRPSALCYSSGFATAMGVVPTLMQGPNDLILIDRFAHACLVDAARASGARLRVFAHNDVEQLDHLLKKNSKKFRRILIIAEALYSMDGDFCPLNEFVALKEKYGALLLLDEAHSTGIQGPEGRGWAASHGLSQHIDIGMGTLGKALGSSGGFVVLEQKLREILINRSRQFIFTTAPPGACCAAAMAAIEICLSKEGEKLRKDLQKNNILMRTLLYKPMSESPILPYHLGNEQLALQVSQQLAQLGWLLPAIRYPTVKKGTARLRITVKSFHTQQQITSLVAAIQEAHKNCNKEIS